MRKKLAYSGGVSAFLIAMLCNPDPNALANPLTCAEVPGGALTSSKPAVATALQGLTLDLFVRGLDDRIYENAWVHPDGFTSWDEVPGDGLTLSEPTAVFFQNHPWVFVRGRSNHIYYNKLDGAGWTEVPGNWQTLSGPTAIVGGAKEFIYLVVRGTDDVIYAKYFFGSNNTWSSWFDITANNPNTSSVYSISEPTAVWGAAGNNRAWVFIRGTDNRIYLHDGFGLSEVPGGALAVAGPSAVVENGVVKLFITGTNDGIWENDFSGNNWSGWVAVTGTAFTPLGPAAVEAFEGPPNGTTLVYVRTEDEKIFECG